MKKIIKIKSITDVITNSSSEVFIMTQKSAEEKLPITQGEGFITPLNEEWFNNRTTDKRYVSKCPINEWEIICEFLDLNKEDFAELKKDDEWWPYEYYELKNDGKDWIDYLDNHRDEILDKLKGYVIFQTEDHFTDAWEHIERWRDESKVWDSRH